MFAIFSVNTVYTHSTSTLNPSYLHSHVLSLFTTKKKQVKDQVEHWHRLIRDTTRNFFKFRFYPYLQHEWLQRSEGINNKINVLIVSWTPQRRKLSLWWDSLSPWKHTLSLNVVSKTFLPSSNPLLLHPSQCRRTRLVLNSFPVRWQWSQGRQLRKALRGGYRSLVNST